MSAFDNIRPIQWEHGKLRLIDQRILPQSETWLEYEASADVADAITSMVVRGAPAIGITAAYGVVLAAQRRYRESADGWRSAIEDDLKYLAASRPTAVNLFWAIERMRGVIESVAVGGPGPALLAEAQHIHQEDVAANLRMGELGAALIEGEGGGILTHCNAGALATGGYGTALGVIRSAFAAGKTAMVYADETRPWMQGARLTAWEMVHDDIPVTLLADGAAAYLMKQGKVQWVVVGSDRIAANGDVANKIGTYSAALAARYHGVKFMVVAPTSTVDMSVASGGEIPIESRSTDEILGLAGQRIAAEKAQAWNPVFDVTPADLVDAIVTEKGVVLNPNTEKMAVMMKS
ncbi:S-methyl-5-thioribose-1-phosphate isomerase [Solemya pervernicosa gill symbiont]|uniref:Methylthioribose-1-phosphate isomerase n=2 Tax=Gammaproteobacteria incertae sedis TaxID=118884 RepID=A0A1T2L3P3_9GAMM|nr:S-methyl-5-thioribose-1-phosphate isomerase [Candidatus Reidiella endopervernicosa]OOZ39723.1 S-methyl-5-thioribose-1-phosphate isomerase [Solemya pervernicosa gill symbiont]QKQ26648.1 S-methyl-5-thioribose-1-phosphate isomerase [Candidatus Reidiella endopervernicosa]